MLHRSSSATQELPGELGTAHLRHSMCSALLLRALAAASDSSSSSLCIHHHKVGVACLLRPACCCCTCCSLPCCCARRAALQLGALQQRCVAREKVDQGAAQLLRALLQLRGAAVQQHHHGLAVVHLWGKAKDVEISTR